MAYRKAAATKNLLKEKYANVTEKQCKEYITTCPIAAGQEPLLKKRKGAAKRCKRDVCTCGGLLLVLCVGLEQLLLCFRL